MGNSASTWLVIVLAVLAANLPFLNERFLAIIALGRFSKASVPDDAVHTGQPSISKPMWLRLLELIILYFCVGGIGFMLESAAGNRFPQGWEFYAINACLFLVLAFPGFVYRYLRRRHD
ncbi:DUF2818 family protein [Undibacterium sp. TS12]|uniref:DUF2818 family protein n=1 Tax=Undibacterium sp. TS12 TaxID=2908202 RepID=UPI001F4C684A|nr:DUF2818 family protein [Undibacterium sp. TS12]